MSSLATPLRRQLENAVGQARKLSEAGALHALQALAVHEPDPYRHMDEAARTLRRQLRAQARQLGDGESLHKPGAYEIKHLAEKLAYDQWHRLLFARYLLENNLLISPEHGVAVSLDDCEELAPSVGLRDAWAIAARFAAKELPEIFRADDPTGAVELAVNDRQPMIALVTGLPVEVFTASDSLGWCYQFWQAEKKDEVNAAGNKIGADELPAVTQLFTEDYMVDFLLDNTLGAWHAGKVLAARPELAKKAESESELRQAVSLPGRPWTYLRFTHREDGAWTPAAGTFDGWPRKAKELKCLDPCMGSGHFVVAMFERLVALRIAEEGLEEAEAVAATVGENLFGLELDPRCTQIGAFNLALTAWRRAGHCVLPAMNIACSGLAPNAKRADWLRLARGDDRLERGMARLYAMFDTAAEIGSLLNPRRIGGDLLEAEFHELQPLLDQAFARDSDDDAGMEMAVTAKGLAKAAEILSRQFTFVGTNVPYLGREGHSEVLVKHADKEVPHAAADLATLMLERCLDFLNHEGALAVVLPQNWWVGQAYRDFRREFLPKTSWRLSVVLGEEAWETFGNRGPNTILLIAENGTSMASQTFHAIDVSTKPRTPVIGREQKALALSGSPAAERRLCSIFKVDQLAPLKTNDCRISVAELSAHRPLSDLVVSGEGSSTGDNDRFMRAWWEVSDRSRWLGYCGPGEAAGLACDSSFVIDWQQGTGALASSDQARIQSTNLWSRRGILVGRVRGITATLFWGGSFSKGAVLICPKNDHDTAAILTFLRSSDYEHTVRQIDPRVSAATSVLTAVPFDLPYWKQVAQEQFPQGMPKPFSSDPTQWLFNGHPADSDHPLHVAVARLLGYQWPRQTGSSFPDCPALSPDGLEALADADGIVPISPIKGETAAAERLRDVLARAHGPEWSASRQQELLAQVESAGASLEDWLRNAFFEQHCKLFQNRPFIWHIWDGHKSGFSALVNYHKLTYANLEKLIYAYLGDWIRRQQAAVEAGESGSDARLQAAKNLQGTLKLILEGEPPFDIFVRWKPLSQQAIGWQPDLNDGVRVNIRPFMARDIPGGKKGAGVLRAKPNIKWDKDRGKEPTRHKAEYPWFWGWDEKAQDFAGVGKEPDGNRWNDCHYSNAFKRSKRAGQA